VAGWENRVWGNIGGLYKIPNHVEERSPWKPGLPPWFSTESRSVTARGRKERGGRGADSWVPHGSDKEEGARLSAKREKEEARCCSAWAAACWAAWEGASRPERGRVGPRPAEGEGGEGFGWGFSLFFNLFSIAF